MGGRDLPRTEGVYTPRSSTPFLPGHVMHDVTKTNHARAQTLIYKLDCASDNWKGRGSPQDFANTRLRSVTPTRGLSPRAATPRAMTPRAATPRAQTPRERKESERNTYKPAIQPAWLKHDRQVLRFFAYFQEPVNERPKENSRVRHCVLCYYLEDGTIQVTEPKVENSGIWPQGPFIQRHRIAKGDGFWGPEHIRLGTTVQLYGRGFRILNCDDFTKHFYKEAGYVLGDAEEAPLDAHTLEAQRRKAETPVPPEVLESKQYTELKLGGSRKNVKLRQFMENDRKVLRFHAYWDDPGKYGSRQFFTVHYYLADDTVEILNQYARNSGRDPYPVFFTRGVMKKAPTTAYAPGMVEPVSSQVRPADFKLGECLPVYGRQFFLYDCDAATKAFYKEYLGLEMRPVPVDMEADVTKVELLPPPHIGFGSEEDTLGSCRWLEPRPPKRDQAYLLASSSKVLRFEARPANGLAEDYERKFIVAYYLGDSSVACFEMKQRNSGQVEGKFRERAELVNPNTGALFKACEFFVGQTVRVSAMPLLLTKADEYTLKHMEKDSKTWPMSSPDAVAQKLQGFNFAEAGPSMSPEDLREAVEAQLGFQLVDQELITLIRYFRDRNSVNILMADLQKAAEM